jgi:hypothetical protein
MAQIIAGLFSDQTQADQALEALSAAGYGAEDVTSFYLNPPGQHAQYPIGGDAHHDEGTKKSGKTAAAGGAIGGVTGLAVGTVAGAAAEPGLAAAAALAGAGVGAYVGSLAGGLKGTEPGDPDKATIEEPVERADGIMVAVRTDRLGSDPGQEDRAIRILHDLGAADIERATGEWMEGTWVNFDPRRTPQLVDLREHRVAGAPDPLEKRLPPS